jgi:AcrR family transcriptional regulator
MTSLKYDNMSETKQSQIRRRNDPRNRPALRKSERTRQAILDAALKFLWTHPFRELTVGELTSLAGTSRSAFYQYFEDLHDLMEALLRGMQEDIFGVAAPWLQGEGDPIALLEETVEGLVRVCYQQGPIVRAVSDAAPMDGRLEKAWADFLKDFDDAATQRIEQHQAAGLITPFAARPVAIALNRMDAYLMIHHFGRRPRGNRESVRDAILRVWISTLYGDGALANCLSRSKASTNVKKK